MPVFENSLFHQTCGKWQSKIHAVLDFKCRHDSLAQTKNEPQGFEALLTSLVTDPEEDWPLTELLC